MKKFSGNEVYLNDNKFMLLTCLLIPRPYYPLSASHSVSLAITIAFSPSPEPPKTTEAYNPMPGIKADLIRA